MVLAYQPQFRVHGATTWIPFGSPTPSLSVAITGLTVSTSYDFEVVASNSFGSTASNIVVASTTSSGGTAPPGSVAGSQTSGSVNPIVAGPASGTALTSGSLAITGITIADVTFNITPGVGSYTVGGHTYTISTADNTFTVDGNLISSGTKTARSVYYNGQVYAQDQVSNSWYTWDGANFNAAATPPPVPPPFSVTITTTAGTLTTPGSPVIIILAAAGGYIKDSAGNIWTIVGGVVKINGANAASSSGVVKLVYINNTIWQFNGSFWWAWTGSTWQSTSTPTIDPSAGLGSATGNGTTSITISDTLPNCQGDVASLLLAAPGTVTTANVKVSVFDPTGATNSITVPISVVAPAAPAPPTGLVVI